MKKKILLEALRSDSLRRVIDDLIENENFELIGWVSRNLQSILMPFIDIYEEGDQYVVVADVPGFSRDELEIEVTEAEDILYLGGRREKKLVDYIEDGRTMEFEKKINLPGAVNGEGEAEYEDGVLVIELEKEDNGSGEIDVK